MQNNKRVSKDEKDKLKTVTLDRKNFGKLKTIGEIFEAKSFGFKLLRCLTSGDSARSWQRTFDKNDPHINEFIKKLNYEN